jgi:predicted nucleic acid-binding protein
VIVVDASVALKWFFAESDTPSATNVLRANHGNMVMPEQFLTEVLSGLVRQANMDNEHVEAVRRKATDFLEMNLDGVFAVKSAVAIMSRATEIALQLRHPLKDCVYLAFAESLGARLVTADLRFAAKAREAYPAIDILGE